MTQPVNGLSTPSVYNKMFCDAAAGGLSGAVVIGLLGPLLAIKAAAQGARSSNSAFSVKRVYHSMGGIFGMWRGMGGFMASFPATTLFQTAVKGVFDNWLPSLASSMAAGAFSGFPVAVAENVMKKQQKYGESWIITMKTIVAVQGWKRLFDGALFTVGRESIFGSTYLVLVPFLTAKIQEKTKDRLGRYSNIAAQFLAGAMGGTIGTLLSHRADTAITLMQREGFTFKEALYESKGFPGFFWRNVVVIVAVTFIPPVQGVVQRTLQG